MKEGQVHEFIDLWLHFCRENSSCRVHIYDAIYQMLKDRNLFLGVGEGWQDGGCKNWTLLIRGGSVNEGVGGVAVFFR